MLSIRSILKKEVIAFLKVGYLNIGRIELVWDFFVCSNYSNLLTGFISWVLVKKGRLLNQGTKYSLSSTVSYRSRGVYLPPKGSLRTQIINEILTIDCGK